LSEISEETAFTSILEVGKIVDFFSVIGFAFSVQEATKNTKKASV
jgi:hypothetical protein